VSDDLVSDSDRAALVADLDNILGFEVTLPPLPEIITWLESTPDDSWWEGPTFRSPCGTKHCVLSHIHRRWGGNGMDEFEERYSTSYMIGLRVNDGPSEAYPQGHPKDRALAYLRAMEAGRELTTHQSMDRQAGLDTDSEGER
jgi:hypothetical protein